jgi:hypothetical protein
VGLQAHFQRELLTAEPAVVLQRRDSHQLINQSVISNQLNKQKLCPHVGLQAHLQRELLTAEPAVVLCSPETPINFSTNQ